MSNNETAPDKHNFARELFVDADEAARFLKVNRRTILQWARSSTLPAYPLGRGTRKSWRFLTSELAEWLRAQGNLGAEQAG